MMKRKNRRREFVKFVEIFSLLMQHAHARSTFLSNYGEKESIFEAFSF